MISELISFILHIDVHLAALVVSYGALVYLILFLIIFAETGLVVTPFLPGDSLLFAAGALAAVSTLSLPALLLLLILAAIIGDAVNYTIGRYFGPKIFRTEKGLLFNKKHLVTTQKFYEKHGSKTIILARFVPIVRTFAPFVAGIGNMKYPKFAFYNVIGGLAWVSLFVLSGYLFGNIPVISDNFGIVIIIIILISLVPLLIEFLKSRRKKL